MPRFPRLVALLGLFACGDPSGSDPSATDTDERAVPGAPTATFTVSEVVPTVVFVTWETSAPAARSWVEYGLDGALDRSTPAVAGGTSHERTLLGLKAGRTYAYRAVSELADGTRVESPIGSVTLEPVPQGMPRLNPSMPPSASSQLDGRYLLASVISPDGSWVQILDGEGDVVWYHPAAPGTMIVTSKPSLDGTDVLFAEYDMGQAIDTGRVVRVGLDGRERIETRTVLAHHDFVEHADGTIAWLGYTYDPDGELIVSDVIREIPEGATDAEAPVVVYDWFESPDYGFWDICDHTSEWNSDPAYKEWTHSNSLMYDAATDHYYLQSKYHDTLVKIERSTGRIVWQLNGRYGDFTLPGGGAPWTAVGQTALWSHAHMSHLWDGGMVVFDNGYHYPSGNVSRVAEYAFDEATMTVEKVWEYVEPKGKFTQLMGDVRKLPGGNYVVSWSSLGRIDEITPERQVVWQVELALGAVTGRTTVLDGLYPPE